MTNVYGQKGSTNTQQELGKTTMPTGGKGAGNVYWSAMPNTQGELKKVRPCQGGGSSRSAGIPAQGVPRVGMPKA